MDPPLSERVGFVGAAARFYHRTYFADYVGFVLLEGAYVLVRQAMLHTFPKLTD